MSFYSLWPSNILIEDNFLPEVEFQKVKNFIMHKLNEEGLTVVNFNSHQLPSDLYSLQKSIYAIFQIYCQKSQENSEMFDLEIFQAHQVLRYDQNTADEYIMHTHHDQAEGGYFALTFCLNVSETTSFDHVGGELAIYKNCSSANYPDGIVYIKPRKNRIVIFPGFLLHSVRPYFGLEPRVTIAILFNKTRGQIQKMKISILD